MKNESNDIFLSHDDLISSKVILEYKTSKINLHSQIFILFHKNNSLYTFRHKIKMHPHIQVIQSRRIRRRIRYSQYKSNDMLRRIITIRQQNTNSLLVNQFFNGSSFY
jgi:hypothetical protein